ncbi:olfactory receptor 5AR1-like [Phyllobates terribilis]|uniref:olfactory receptor 5AR1-like n=1 Tax=Phyllobates terribilis TaxID=111132 RepID=UPI003CCB58FD
MAENNVSAVAEFILLGLTNNHMLQIILFVVFLIIYMITLTGNFLIVLVAITDTSLHNPMYFFLANLSCLDIIYSTTIIPRMLRDFISSRRNISMGECVTQMFISVALAEVECILLAVMAYDRFVAICHPLHYMTIIRRPVCIKIALGAWISGFLLTVPSVISVWSVDRCGQNEINHFECEIPELIALACGNIVVIQLLNFILGSALLIIPTIFITATYVRIIRSVLRIATSAGRKKAFSTCTFHIIVVTIFYGLPMFSYMNPKARSDAGTVKIYTVFYTTITPLLNPIIYTLRNKDIKRSLRKITKKVT